jgi:hypothetical protein
VIGVDLTADPKAVSLERVHARQPIQPDSRDGEFGGDSGTREMAQLCQRAAVDPSTIADDADAIAHSLDLTEKWLDSSTVRPCARSLATSSRKTASINGSRPEVGSSSTNNSTSEASAATNTTF